MTSYAERVRQAVDDPAWQKFRKGLKGLHTSQKLGRLRGYWISGATHSHKFDMYNRSKYKDCDVCIRVDNYLKALARGGQLTAPMSLEVALDHNWDLQIRK